MVAGVECGALGVWSGIVHTGVSMRGLLEVMARNCLQRGAGTYACGPVCVCMCPCEYMQGEHVAPETVLPASWNLSLGVSAPLSSVLLQSWAAPCAPPRVFH